MVGADGLIPGVTELEVAETSERTPFPAVARTVNVYAVPAFSVVNTAGEAPVTVCPPLDVTVYVMVLLPVYVEAVNGTETWPFVLLNVGVPMVGVVGFLPPLSSD
jgi:hypothetical protein